MAHQNTPKSEKVAELWKGISLWKVHLDVLKERDVNARVMPLEKFELLVNNIKKDKRLESLPLVTPVSSDEFGNQEFLILSGHHRTRASRKAGVMEIFVLSVDDPLSMDEIIAKQLAHNALSGYDNPEVLAQLYNSIEDMNAKLSSGLSGLEISNIELPSIKADEIKVEFDYEPIYILFLPKQIDYLDKIFSSLEEEAKVYLADKAEFERFKNVALEISKRNNIRNVASIMLKMLEITENYLKATKPVETEVAKGSLKGDKKKAN